MPYRWKTQKENSGRTVWATVAQVTTAERASLNTQHTEDHWIPLSSAKNRNLRVMCEQRLTKSVQLNTGIMHLVFSCPHFINFIGVRKSLQTNTPQSKTPRWRHALDMSNSIHFANLQYFTHRTAALANRITPWSDAQVNKRVCRVRVTRYGWYWHLKGVQMRQIASLK